MAHSAGAAAGPTGAVVELAGAAVGLLRGCWGAGIIQPSRPKRHFRGSKGPFRNPRGSPGPLGGVQNHSPGKSLVKEILQNAYKTCVILTIMMFLFVKY